MSQGTAPSKSPQQNAQNPLVQSARGDAAGIERPRGGSRPAPKQLRAHRVPPRAPLQKHIASKKRTNSRAAGLPLGTPIFPIGPGKSMLTMLYKTDEKKSMSFFFRNCFIAFLYVSLHGEFENTKQTFVGVKKNSKKHRPPTLDFFFQRPFWIGRSETKNQKSDRVKKFPRYLFPAVFELPLPRNAPKRDMHKQISRKIGF
jgi:hypothetical protein